MKERRKIQNQNNRGITLVALVVTIVVLLILAGVSIITLFDENGIIKSAQKAKEETEKSVQNDIAGLQNITNELNKYGNGSDESGANLDDYATLNIKSFVGKFMRQKADYLRIKVEVCNNADENDKIAFNVGTDWENNIDNSNNKNQTFLRSSAKLEMIQDLNNDSEYKANNTKITLGTLNAFTDVSITNLKVKKENEYTVKISIQGVDVSKGTVVPRTLDLIQTSIGNIGKVTENKNVTFEKNNVAWWKVLNINDDENTNTGDAALLNNAIRGTLGTCGGEYEVQSGDSNLAGNVIQLLDNKGNSAINPDFIGLDINRDGTINKEDYRIIMDMISAKY